MENDYLSLLNKEQKSAVISVDGPTLILAGAGTGKTRTITTRIAHIIKYNLAFAGEILAVTFTNKAASEMLSRVSELTDASGIWLGTFHGIATKILRNHAEVVGLKSNFTIINSDDQAKVVKNIISQMYSNYSLEKHSIIVSIIQKWKEKGISSKDIIFDKLFKQSHVTALTIYHHYQEYLKLLNSVDFCDLLLYNIKIFRENRDILSYYQNKFKYIMVDEYQDTNIIQYLWLNLLAQEHKNICCVGDDDQSIYSWRGAEVENILKFSDDFPQAKVVRLERNYRSTIHILATASCIINNNKCRLKKTLWTKSSGGKKVRLMKFFDGKAEAKYICELILKLSEYNFSDIAVLVRAGFQARIFEEYFVKYSIPYKVVSGVKFYERQEVKDIISYLRIVINSSDNLAFERIINSPKRGIGASTLKKVYSVAQENSTSFIEATKILVDSNQFTKRTKTTLKYLLDKISSWKELLTECPLSKATKIIVDQSGYTKMLESEGVTGLSRIENIKELLSALNSFNDAVSFLEHISLVSDIDSVNSDNAVHVMTLHAAKGLEFSCVFLPGWEEGVFPHQRSFHDKTGKSLEEERRLAYVGITRAKDRLYISCSSRREINNVWKIMRNSRFIRELPVKNIEVIKHNMSCPIELQVDRSFLKQNSS